MTKREAILRTLNREVTEFVPYSFDMTSGVGEMVYKWLSENGKLADDGFIGDYFQFVGHGNPRDFKREKVGEYLYKDEFGCVWDYSPRRGEVGDVGSLWKPPLSEASLDGYVFPDGAAEGRFDHVKPEQVTAGGKYVVLGITGLLDTCWHLRGFENFLCDLADEDSFAEEILDLGAQYICDIVEAAPSCVDGVRFTEDWGLQKGLVMSPSLWRRLLKPRLKKMYDAARTRGFHVLLHTCGDVTQILPDIVELGADMLNPLQPEAMDVHKVKREFGKDFVIYGSVGCQSTLPFGTVQDVVDEVRDRVRTLGKGGGLVIGPAGAIPRDAKPENVRKLVELCMSGLRFE